MEAIEIFPLTEQAVASLLAARDPSEPPGPHANCQRATTRWPFPGTVELWLPNAKGGERYGLATSVNLSLHGVGIQFEEPLDPGVELGLAIHEPEASFHGRGTVRHCSETSDGTFLIGLQFQYAA